MSAGRGRTSGPPRDPLVRAQLEKILASECFSRSERLSSFLRFVVEETLQGRGDTLKEPVLAHELYGREVDFDGANPIVRVDARRLRDKLREYYADRAADPVVISLPKGSYVPAFELAEAPSPADSRQVLRGAAAVALGIGALLAAGYAALTLTAARPAVPPGRIVLAVLPFQNLTGDPEQEYLSDGLTEELIAVLGSVAHAARHHRADVACGRLTTKRAGEIGRELGTYARAAFGGLVIALASQRSDRRPDRTTGLGRTVRTRRAKRARTAG